MAFEIERKFLVKGDAWRGLAEPVRIRQGYVATKDGTTVRVRVVGDKAFLTLKDHAVGLVRHEFEYPIPRDDAETILNTMCGNLVEKNRMVSENARRSVGHAVNKISRTPLTSKQQC